MFFFFFFSVVLGTRDPESLFFSAIAAVIEHRDADARNLIADCIVQLDLPRVYLMLN